ncbi:hypothetical protein CCZ01_05550 [Helicobacter monodelphidis]|nr:hypothetical protein CCZ01_05550 [Helicobacter sp. 15-1451]
MTTFYHYRNYKLYNSLFSGLSIGSVFVIYTPLPPITYSIGGIFLAIAMWAVAYLYPKILNRHSYYKILLFIELLPFFIILIFIFSYIFISRSTPLYIAILIYSFYQIIFIFGNYLLRAETMIFHHKQAIMALDISKQQGSFIGLILAFILYAFIEWQQSFRTPTNYDKQEQIFYIHLVLLINQILVIHSLIRSFQRNR